MRGLSTKMAVLIAAILALLLVAYALAGGGRERADRKPHCSSKPALDLVKRELFRRGAAVRGSTDPVFAAAAQSSVLRTQPPVYRRHHRGSDHVTCTGSVSLDLPPGIAAAGGRRNIAGKAVYELQAGPVGGPRLRRLSKAGPIVTMLATVTQAGDMPQPVVAVPDTDQRASAEAPAPAERQAAAPAQSKARPAAATRPRPQAHSTPVRRPSATAAAPSKPSAPPRQPDPQAAASDPPAAARPSFNCRYARTRGEIAVCSSPGLAALDRQMASQFYRAMEVASRGQRAMLQRTRNRFLRFRDSCGTAACMADAYRGRMREIDDIMTGNW